MAIPSISLFSSSEIQIERSQRGYFLPQYVIVNCCQITQYFKDHREDTHRLRPLQFVVTKAYLVTLRCELVTAVLLRPITAQASQSDHQI